MKQILIYSKDRSWCLTRDASLRRNRVQGISIMDFETWATARSKLHIPDLVPAIALNLVLCIVEIRA
jgi:hypothetical protein